MPNLVAVKSDNVMFDEISKFVPLTPWVGKVLKMCVIHLSESHMSRLQI